MKALIAIACLMTLMGCSSNSPDKAREETPECMTYRAMMTAPMAPDAIERLRVACENDR